MTRINCIDPSELHDKHLLAEYRELPRIFSIVRSHIEANTLSLVDIPRQYTLGKGHMKFFYNKLNYLYLRQVQLIKELGSRNYTVSFQHPGDFLEGMPEYVLNDWIPTPEAIAINTARINERLAVMKIPTLKFLVKEK